MQYAFPNWFHAAGAIAGDGEVERYSFSVVKCNCEDSPCRIESDGIYDAPDFDVVVSSFDSEVERRGQGLYIATEDGLSHASATLDYPFGYIHGWGEAKSPADTRVCISRFRPDQLRGVVYVDMRDGGYVPLSDWYPSVTIAIPFEFTFVPHSGWYYYGDRPWEDKPEGTDDFNILYGDLTYDQAWPWDQITDPSVRDALYELYTPWNNP